MWWRWWAQWSGVKDGMAHLRFRCMVQACRLPSHDMDQRRRGLAATARKQPNTSHGHLHPLQPLKQRRYSISNTVTPTAPTYVLPDVRGEAFPHQQINRPERALPHHTLSVVLQMPMVLASQDMGEWLQLQASLVVAPRKPGNRTGERPGRASDGQVLDSKWPFSASDPI